VRGKGLQARRQEGERSPYPSVEGESILKATQARASGRGLGEREVKGRREGLWDGGW